MQPTTFLNRVLEPPRYGYEQQGVFYKPTTGELIREFWFRFNPFSNRKNWLTFFGWASTFSLVIPFFVFFAKYFSWPLFFVGFIYSMVILGTHGTIWYHRYSTHRAYKFRNGFARFFVKYAVVKIIPDEIYVVSHYVHHQISEKPGDPYNVHGGWLYCFLADAIHQPIRKDLTEAEYLKVTAMMNHTGLRCNSYQEYLKWGSLCHPLFTVLEFACNWGFWFAAFYLLGGAPLAFAIFASCAVWAFGIRTFNYDGHGGGKDKRKEGIDFNRNDLSINQLWPGLVTGEWHNNHHLYPNGARAGFQPYQLDYAWYFIRFYHAIGGITSYRDYRQDFYDKYMIPYLTLAGSSTTSA
jgi:stearoyl-CoA desaturase (delta-9 desaturase)